MIPQQKILRVFKLISILAQRPGRTLSQLAVYLEVEERTVRRYLHLLEEIGYFVDQDPVTGRYFLFEADPRQRGTFTQEESSLIRQLLAAIPTEHPLRDSIHKKVYVTSELVPLAQDLLDIHHGRMVERLARAIRDEKQVQLVRYHSTNSTSQTDRLVEPLAFTDNYTLLRAYEPASGIVKSFKIQRIEEVLLLLTPITYQDGVPPSDIFGFTDEAPSTVKLGLSTRAYRLLIEDYPAARPFTLPQTDERFPYRLEAEMRSEVGIGRFILGIPGEVVVEETQKLREYLRQRVGQFVL
ncbi:helix-turn-helix transcriptional regulator [Telluribacter sp.]|jgi:predicted DNA-binding transcriptional regulator YafY|uniref:helix-turn-helix transcriptional regulator n=1 Tax=Telluribacter sp. TaxID=1978767 RepID=UPI002E0DDAB3|nr:WYL domain-containing protein [Telluribacter sp.]